MKKLRARLLRYKWYVASENILLFSLWYFLLFSLGVVAVKHILYPYAKMIWTNL